MTHQVSVPRSGSAPTAKRTGSTEGAPIRKLIVYTLATLVVAASVTVAAVVVSGDDAPTSTGFAQAREQQYVDGLNPASDVPGSLGLSGTATIDRSFQANETARLQGLAPTVDGSFQTNETARLQGLAPSIDGSFQANEAARMQALVNGINPATDVPGALSGTVTSDGSFQANETARLQGLAPSIDGSFQANEAARMQALVNGINPATDVPGALSGTVTSDGSFQANETARLQGLAPSIDGSFQANEAARMQALVNGINPATDVPGALSGTVTSDGSFQANETARLQSLEPSDVPERTLWVSRHR